MPRRIVAVAAAAVLAMSGWRAFAQAKVEPVNDRPNPYVVVENFFKLPAGRQWGATSAIDIDKDGTSIWVAERCGGNSSCVSNAGRPDPEIRCEGEPRHEFRQRDDRVAARHPRRS